jgi:hypothetical protein
MVPVATTATNTCYDSKWVGNPESMKHMAAHQQSLELFREITFLESAAELLAILKFPSLAFQSDVADSQT